MHTYLIILNCIYRALPSMRNSNELRQQGIDDNTTIVTFSIKFYYTKEFAEVTDDVELYMDQVIFTLLCYKGINNKIRINVEN